ncbi:hypothetical protein U9M48_000666 [Paspalum notatum var. saurae]|uniref:Uncharacterized protein n=1 Tax=Paspalum notatum var. saurae TaxID=547442 RepID=A0AAQ3PM16_PASNO
MQPHVPDRLDPRRPRITRAHSFESAVDDISAQFLAQESRESAKREVHPSGGWALPSSRLVWVQMYKILSRVYNLYV